MESIVCIDCDEILSGVDAYINTGATNPRCQKCSLANCRRILEFSEAMLRDMGEVPESDKLRELTKSMNAIVSTFYTNAPPVRRLIQIVNIAETCLETISGQWGRQ